MDDLLSRFDVSKIDTPYTGNKEYMDDLFAITRLQLEDCLENGADYASYTPDEETAALVENLYLYTDRRIQATHDIFFPLPFLRMAFFLDAFEERALILSLLIHADRANENLIASLQPDTKAIYPSFDLCAHLLGKPSHESMDLFFTLQRKLFKFFFIKGHPTAPLRTLLAPSERIVKFILSRETEPYTEHYFSVFVNDTLTDSVIQSSVQDAVLRVLLPQNDDESGEVSERCKVICLTGDEGSGRKFTVRQTAAVFSRNVIYADTAALYTDDIAVFIERIHVLVRESLLQNAVLCLYNFDFFSDNTTEHLSSINTLLKTITEDLTLLFVCTGRDTPLHISDSLLPLDEYIIEIPLPTRMERELLWLHYAKDLPEAIDRPGLAGKFKLTPGKIVNAIGEAERLSLANGQPVTMDMLHKCCYHQTATHLKEKATLVYPTQVLKDLILPPEQLEQIIFTIERVKLRGLVYEDWGFDKKLTYGKGLTVLFEGPPGTGKTMAAHIIANSLRLEMYKVDLARVVSKYIGETEQSLNMIFNEARKSNVLLFFDETDALFGKRTEVKDAKDRYANIETAFLLQKVEEYDGVVIMATNHLQNIDDAFMRRINTIVHFPFPGKTDRMRIWRSMFPPEMPVSNLDYDYLGGQFELSGGDIKNVALTAAFMAARDNDELKMIHIIKALKSELGKLGKAVLKEDFGQYQYLLLQ